MILLTIDEIKAQCRILSDDENPSLEVFGAAAEAHAARLIGRPIVADEPADLKAAVLMLAATLYAQRESELTLQTYEHRACRAIFDLHRENMGV